MDTGFVTDEQEKSKLENRIVKYWSERSQLFYEQRIRELHDDIAKRWMAQIYRYIPEGKKLHILDAGCGAGFFSVLLAKEGHTVTGIDLTENMVTLAKRLAEEEHVSCNFEMMDAQNLDFADESFDMIISRNLTWTLPDAKRAYAEWLRVLVPGGSLLNFDADYGKDNCADKANLPEHHAHNLLGDDMLRECEEIKQQLDITRHKRPYWDIALLESLGVSDFRISLDTGAKIYIRKDEFYNPAMVFTLCCNKK